MNAPNVAELFILDDGEKLVEVTDDTKIPNAATFKIVKQDHTLGNMLRAQLLTMPTVLFSGYKLPHPLNPHFLLKVQTDGSITPQEALETATKELIGILAILESKFKKEFDFKRSMGPSGLSAQALVDDPYGTGVGSGTTGDWGASASGRTGAGDYLDL